MLAYSPYDQLAGRRVAPRPAGDRGGARPAGDGARAREVGGRAARVGPGVVAALRLPRARQGPARTSGRPGAPAISATRPRSMPGSSTGWECRMSESLHDEVIRVARDLIRLDTTNAREPGLGQRDAVRRVPRRLPQRGTAWSASWWPARPTGPTWSRGSPGSRRPTPRLDHRRDRRRRVAGVRRPHRRRAVRPARLDPPAVRGRARRRRLAVGPRRGRHEERGGGPRGGDGRAGAERLPPERRPVVARRRRRGGRVRRRRDALAARGAPRHPAHPQHQRGRRGADARWPTAARWSGAPSARRARCPVAGHGCRRGRPRVGADAGEQRRTAAGAADRPPRRRDAGATGGDADGDRDARARCWGATSPTCGRAVAEAEALHPSLAGSITALMGSTLAPTMLCGVQQAQRDAGPGHRRGRLPDPARHDPGRRRGPGAGAARRRHPLRAGAGPRRSSRRRAHRSTGPVPAAIAAFLAAEGDPAIVLPTHVHRVHRQQLPARRRRHRGVRLQPLPQPRPSRCWTPATTTPTSGCTSTTCCCRRASTSTSPGGSSAERSAFPEPASTSDLRGLMLDYLDFLRGVVADKVDGLTEGELRRVRGAVGVDAGRAGQPPGRTSSGGGCAGASWPSRYTDPWRDAADDDGWVTPGATPAELRGLLEAAGARSRARSSRRTT